MRVTCLAVPPLFYIIAAEKDRLKSFSQIGPLACGESGGAGGESGGAGGVDEGGGGDRGGAVSPRESASAMKECKL